MAFSPPVFRRTRLAPSPTGRLHLGHARTFLITWWLARQCGAEVIMRMEDLDQTRRRAESVQQAYEDLRWLGMDWDDVGEHEDAGAASPTMGVVDGAIVQSLRRERYAQALERLIERDAVYPCVCSRADIAAAVAASVGAPQEGDVSLRYPGTCAARGLRVRREGTVWRARDERGVEQPACWRLRVPAGAVAFDDAVAGAQSIDVSADAGDFAVTRFDGTPAYQFAVVVDDADLGIDMVIRGDDLLSSTPRQLLVYRALGLTPPRFAHVPLVVGADGKRLAKRHGESRIAQYRAAGVWAERVVGWAAWRSGQIPAPIEVSAREMVARFDVGKLPREAVVLGEEDLGWLRE